MYVFWLSIAAQQTISKFSGLKQSFRIIFLVLWVDGLSWVGLTCIQMSTKLDVQGGIFSNVSVGWVSVAGPRGSWLGVPLHAASPYD